MAFEDIMGKVGDLAQAGAAKVGNLAQAGAVKAKEIAEITKLKVNNAAEADSIRKAFTELGKLYYAEHGAAPEEAFAALCEKVTASKEKIEYNKQKIADIRAVGNVTEEEEAAVEEVIAEDIPTDED